MNYVGAEWIIFCTVKMNELKALLSLTLIHALLAS